MAGSKATGFSAEHGIGQLKRGALLRYKPAIEVELMRRVKQAIDPQGIMNPGKIIPPADPFKEWGLSGEALGRFTGSGQ